MKFAVVSVPLAPVRKKPRHQSEMISQLLFGETVEVVRQKKKLWVKVRSLHDEYEGWVTDTLITEVSEQDARMKNSYVTPRLMNTILLDSQRMIVPMGSSLPDLIDGKGRIGTRNFILEGESVDRHTQTPNTERILRLTEQWLNAPYLWGGRTIFGVDCSGFVQVNFKMMGHDLPRDAWQQAGKGSSVKKLSDAICGDLAFFDDKEEIVHVGILLSNEKIIHASGRVRIDSIDKKGIINSETGKRTHNLKVIKRIF